MVLTTLVVSYFMIIFVFKKQTTKVFLAENVSGMLANRHSDAVKSILNMFDDCGYDVTVNMVNVKNYGVAQERKRFFILGFVKI